MPGPNLGTRLYTWLRGELVGTDRTGNRYYRERAAVTCIRTACAGSAAG